MSYDRFIRYIQFEKRYSSNTVHAYQRDLEQFSLFISPQSLEKVTLATIRSWIISLDDSGVEPRSINRKLACLRSFYKFLHSREEIAVNPLLSIKALKTKKSIPQFVKKNEMEQILDHISFPEGFEGIRDQLVLELFYGTGIRISEMIGITHADFNADFSLLKVLGKRNKERIIPIHKNLVIKIKAYNMAKSSLFGFNNQFIITDRGKKPTRMFLYRLVNKYLSATTADKKSPHVLRHTFATHLLNDGADLNAVKELLGHSSLAATQVYTHQSLEKLKKAYELAHPKA